MSPVANQHIELRSSAIHGQKACIAGKRITVQDIYVWHELMGKLPEQIVVEYPLDKNVLDSAQRGRLVTVVGRNIVNVAVALIGNR